MQRMNEYYLRIPQLAGQMKAKTQFALKDNGLDWIGNTTHLIALLFFHQPDGLLAQLVLGDALAVRRQLTLQNFHPRQ